MEKQTPFIPLYLPLVQRSLRVAVVTETYPPEINGVALTIQHMVEGLRRRNHQIQLIRPRQGAGDKPAFTANLQQILLPGFAIPRYPNLQLGLPAGSALRRLWRASRPDVVHIVTEGPLGWSALNEARKLDIPVTSDFHTNFHSYTQHYGIGWMRRPIGAYLRHLHNRALLTMVPDQGLRHELEMQGYQNLAIVGRGVDTDLFNPARRSMELRHSWGVSRNGLVVVHVGRLAAEKNLEAVVDAFDAMSARHPRAKLVWVGDGPQRSVLQVRNPGHIFAGMQTGTDLAAHYASADVFLFPSLTETFGNVTLEAMASGLAVVAYNYAAAAEHIHHGENGLVAEFDNLSLFCDQAAILAGRPEMISRLGGNARQSADGLAWRKICERFEQLLLEIVDEGGRHGKQDRFNPGSDSNLGPGVMSPL
ncbi:MAG: glycosyltransferase family 1 protein [Gammaproteobacteria bacterium]|nr:glycosyltransferase family 1 protein [Gammaproteobacteria bacterium]MBU1979365.1 glycosyltransferase family 1 protein [Gammaproteobacteria bacterium]